MKVEPLIVEVHIHWHGFEPTHVEKEIEVMSLQLEQLVAQVEKNTEVEAGAITLLQELAGRIKANADDPAEIQKLAATLQASAASLAAAIVANTPAEPAPTPTPDPAPAPSPAPSPPPDSPPVDAITGGTSTSGTGPG